jgi:hypothetical protein
MIPMIASDTPTSDQLCSAGACSLIGNSERYEDFINNSSDRELQGISAYTNLLTPEIIVYGSLSGSEYLDLNSTVSNYITGKLGKIMIIAGSWYLPFTDLTNGSSLNQIRVLSASSGASDVLHSSLVVDDTVVYSAIGQVNWFTNDVDSSGNIVIGAVNSSNIASLRNYGTSGGVNFSSTLFSGGPIDPTTLRIAGPVTGNPNYFATARVLKTLPSTYEWKVGRCDSSLVCNSANFNFVSDAAYNANTLTVLDDSNIKEVSLEAYPSSSEARLLVTSDGGSTDTSLYAVRFRSDGDVSCGSCVPVNLLTNSSAQVLSSSKRIATTKIYTNMDIGVAGSSVLAPTENIKDVFFALYPVKSGTGDYIPHLGIFNSEVEVISSSSADTTGTLGHRTSLFSDH